MQLTLNEATAMIQAGIAESERRGFNMALVVVDAGGYLVAAARMDKAALVVPEVALGKAVASALFRQPSGALQERWQGGAPIAVGLMARFQGRFIPHQGAVPIVRDGEVIGAVGVSGARPNEDEEIAQAALAAFSAPAS
jgi:glc operon protein GlcG